MYYNPGIKLQTNTFYIDIRACFRYDINCDINEFQQLDAYT